MKFKVVWIDDTKSWVDSIKDSVKETFEERGLDLELEVFHEIEPAREAILGSYADLLMIDCNLPFNSRGDEFIKELRLARCFAHVIYYSEDDANLETLTQDEYSLHKTNRKGIEPTLEKVVELISMKYKHPSFMRGLLLSEFIDLENLMDDLIAKCFKSEEDLFKRTIIHRGGESFSLMAKQKFIKRLIDDVKGQNAEVDKKIDEIGFSGSQFDKHIIKKRNVLAHAHPSYDVESGYITLISAIEDVVFDSDWFHETRTSIHKHKNQIRDLTSMKLTDVTGS